MDYQGEVYPVSRWTGQKAKHVRERLGDLEQLPTVEQAHAKAANMLANRLQELTVEQSTENTQKVEELERTRQRARKRKDIESDVLLEKQVKHLKCLTGRTSSQTPKRLVWFCGSHHRQTKTNTFAEYRRNRPY